MPYSQPLCGRSVIERFVYHLLLFDFRVLPHYEEETITNCFGDSRSYLGEVAF